MILPLTAIWGGLADYRGGNAQRFDGVFDTDSFNIAAIQRDEPLSYLFEFNGTGAGGQSLISIQGIGIRVRISSFISIQYRSTGGQSGDFEVRFPYPTNENCNFIFTVDGTSSAGGVRGYLNGIEQIATIASDNLTGNLSASGVSFIGSQAGAVNFLDGLIKQVEIIDRVATPAECGLAGTASSFRGAGIAHNSGLYRLAVDFDKVDGQDPTTFTGTPHATIVAIGGSQYENYE